MIYFICWVVFLLLAIIAVPVAQVMSKDKNAPVYDDAYDAEPGEAGMGDEEDLQPLDAEDAGFGGAASDGFGDMPEAADDGGFGGEAEFGGGEDGGFGDAEFGDEDFAAFE